MSSNSLLSNAPDEADNWRLTQIAIIVLIIGACTFLYPHRISDFWVRYSQRLLPTSYAAVSASSAVIAFLNIMLATFVLCYPIKLPLHLPFSDSAIPQVARRSFSQLIRGWRLLWLAWILLYAWLAANWLGLLAGMNEKAVRYIADAFNMLNGFWFFYLFFVLDLPSVTDSSKPDRTKSFHRSIITALVLGVIAFTISALVDFNRIAPVEGQIADTLVRQLVGGYTAIGMAFFFGRLDSHHLPMPRVILAPLYLYVILQMSWGRIVISKNPNNDSDALAILLLALILKFVLFVVVYKKLASGSLLRYFIDVEEAWREKHQQAYASTELNAAPPEAMPIFTEAHEESTMPARSNAVAFHFVIAGFSLFVFAAGAGVSLNTILPVLTIIGGLGVGLLLIYYASTSTKGALAKMCFYAAAFILLFEVIEFIDAMMRHSKR